MNGRRFKPCQEVPQEGVPICERQRGDSTEVPVQHCHTFAGIQVPDADLVIDGGGEELQAGDVRVELDQAGQEERTGINQPLNNAHPTAGQVGWSILG